MKKLALLILVITSLSVVSCRVKQNCEINHTGEIAIINHYGSTVELRVNNEKEGNIDKGMVRTLVRTVGAYEVNVVGYPNVWDTTINVIECDLVEYIIK